MERLCALQAAVVDDALRQLVGSVVLKRGQRQAGQLGECVLGHEANGGIQEGATTRCLVQRQPRCLKPSMMSRTALALSGIRKSSFSVSAYLRVWRVSRSLAE